MGAAVSITRLDLTASQLRKAAGGEKNGAAARRILKRDEVRLNRFGIPKSEGGLWPFRSSQA
jgi:hypothetical protein